MAPEANSFNSFVRSRKYNFIGEKNKETKKP